MGVFIVDFRDNYYLAGFVDGEGCFMIKESRRRGGLRSQFQFVFEITLRADSLYLLLNLQDAFGGYMRYRAGQKGRPMAHPQYRWKIVSRKDICGLVDYFDAFPLVLKAQEYRVWRTAALLYFDYSVGNKGGTHSNPTWLALTMRVRKAQLSYLKRYNVPREDVGGSQITSQLELTVGR